MEKHIIPPAIHRFMEDKQKYILEGLPKKASDRHLQLVELIYAELMRTKENNPTKIDNVDLATTIPEQPVPETLRILPINRKGTKDLTETMQESLADLRQYFLPYDTPITQYTNEIMDTQRQLTQLPIGIDRKPLRLKKKSLIQQPGEGSERKGFLQASCCNDALWSHFPRGACYRKPVNAAILQRGCPQQHKT